MDKYPYLVSVHKKYKNEEPLLFLFKSGSGGLKFINDCLCERYNKVISNDTFTQILTTFLTGKRRFILIAESDNMGHHIEYCLMKKTALLQRALE